MLPFRPVKPALQAQAVATVLLAGELACCGHGVHSAAPVESLNLPALHSEHNATP